MARKGAHLTTMEDIAAAAGVARATLYQYFESKEQIFSELVEESGAALLRVLRHVGPLGPDRSGFASLCRWMDDWAAIYGRYSEVFAQWSAIDAPQGRKPSMLAMWLTSYVDRVTPLIAVSERSDIEPAHVAIGLWALFERYNFQLRTTGEIDGTGTDLAVIAQLMLFPETPAAILAPPRPRTTGTNRSRRPVPLPTSSGPARHDRFDGTGPEARRTILRILDAGGRLFTAAGFHAVNVEQVTTAAGVGRGTFYKYFDSKLDLLAALAVECAERMAALGDALCPEMAEARPRHALLGWIEEFVAFQAVYGGVWRVWSDEPFVGDGSARPGRVAQDALLAGLVRLTGSRLRRDSPDGEAVASMLLGLLQRFPDQAAGTAYECPPEELAPVLQRLIERAFLNPGLSSSG